MLLKPQIVALVSLTIAGLPVGATALAGNAGRGGPPIAAAGRAGSQHGAPANHGAWRAGHWWRGVRGNRFGWWWVVGPAAAFWYPGVLYPYPEFASPYSSAGGVLWCDFYQNYYPNVVTCPSGWENVEPE